MYNFASTPTSRGFDHFYGYFNGAEDYLTHEIQNYLDLHDDKVVDFNRTDEYSAILFQQQVEMRIRAHKAASPDDPLFLYYPMQTVHAPLEALDVYSQGPLCASIANADRKTFCGMAAAADDAVGNLTKVLDEVFPGEGEKGETRRERVRECESKRERGEERKRTHLVTRPPTCMHRA